MHETGLSGSLAPDNPSPGVPITEAAARLGMNRETLRQQIRRGKVPACKIAGQWYVDLSAVPALSGALPGSPNGSLNTMVSGSVSSPDPVASSALNGAVSGVDETTLVSQLRGENRLLREDVAFLRDELQRKHELLQAEQDTRRREVSELHILLQRAQAQIPMPTLASPDEQPPAPKQAAKRRWWWPW